MATLLNIAALSRRTGVAPDTLRKWEQRYGVLRPGRTTGGQRRYTEQDVLRVEWLRDRLGEGWRIGEASRVLADPAAPALTEPDALREALVEATLSSRPGAIESLLDQAFAVLPLETVLADVLLPALRAVGDGWHAGHVTVAQEHALSAKVRARLGALLGDARGGANGTAVFACAPGELHEIGLLMVAVLLRADGWRVEYLGQDTPVAEAVAFAEAVGAGLLCISVGRPESLEALRTQLGQIERDRGAVLVTGGSGITPEQASELDARHAEGDPRRVVARLRRLAPA